MATYPSTRPSVRSLAGRGSWAAGLWSLGSPSTSCSHCTKGTGRGCQTSDGPGSALCRPRHCCSLLSPSPTQQLNSTHSPRPSSLKPPPPGTPMPRGFLQHWQEGRHSVLPHVPHWTVHIPCRRDQARQLSGVHLRLLPCKDPNLTSTTPPSGPF